MTEKDRDKLAETDRDFSSSESGGFVGREEAIHIVGVSGTTFDRIAKDVFGHVRVAEGNSFRYPVEELKAYREYRKRCKQDKRPRLTWSEITTLISTLEERIRVLAWALSPTFGEGKANSHSALRLQKDHPEDFERAERVLKELGFDMEELRNLLEKRAVPPPKPNPPQQTDPTSSNSNTSSRSF